MGGLTVVAALPGAPPRVILSVGRRGPPLRQQIPGCGIPVRPGKTSTSCWEAGVEAVVMACNTASALALAQA